MNKKKVFILISPLAILLILLTVFAWGLASFGLRLMDESKAGTIN